VPELGLGVYVGKTDDNLAWQVLEDDPLLRRNSTDNRNYQSVAARDLKPGGRLFLWVDSRQIDPLATYPTPNTLNVNVAPGDYPYDGTRTTFPGALDYDLSASVPGAGLHRYVGLYLDSANTLQTVDGATTSTANTPTEPTWPDGAFRLAVVRLRNAQTQIIFTLKNDSTNDIFDRRMLWSDENSGGTGSGSSTLTIKNTSGATANDGDVGYINEAGEYKTTTTANAHLPWCAVVTGGANNADIEVATEGVVAINYAGSVPSAGHFLVTSTTAGKATRQATMRPEIMAVCLVAGVGSDGQVARALLLTDTRPIPVAHTNDIYRCDAVSTSNFVSTISGTPSGATLVYGVVSAGAENVLVPSSTSQIAKMVLHNTSIGDSLLISNVNTGTNTITFTTNVPGTWANGHTITVRSQTNTANPLANTYYIDFELVTGNLNALTRAFTGLFALYDAANTPELYIHPYEANSASKAQNYAVSVAAKVTSFNPDPIPILSNRFCMAWQTAGSGTTTVVARCFTEARAAP
jgi:hypothetical protein